MNVLFATALYDDGVLRIPSISIRARVMRFDKPRARFSHYNMGLSELERPCRAASQRVALADDRVGKSTLLTFAPCDALSELGAACWATGQGLSLENGEGAQKGRDVTVRFRY